MTAPADYTNTELITRYVAAFTAAAYHWRTGRKSSELDAALNRLTELADEISRRSPDRMGLIESDHLAGRHVGATLDGDPTALPESLADEITRIAGLLQ